MQAKLNIGVLTGRLPYPHGMAAVQRIHLLARAMAEAGIAVNVWVDGLDHWSVVRNVVPAGTYAGVAFEYLLGKTAASSSKLGRIIDRLRLVCAAGRRIATAARKHRLDGLYFNTPMLKLDFERAIVRFHCQRAKVPVVMGLCELPWSANLSGPSVRKLVSPLYGADGLIYISRYLERWAQGEQEKTGKTVRSLYIPILVDVNEFRPAQLPSVGKKVLFAGSPAYDETLRFLVEAMRMVWARYPDCELVITGGATETTLGPLARSGQGKIRYAGYLKRENLLRAYVESSVLAIPMFNDSRSKARFPTKLGEYLASGRPVVTNDSGDISCFLQNGRDACVVKPGDAASFGEAINQILRMPAWGHEIGQRGRLVAERHFHYARYGPALVQFLSAMRNASN